MSFFQFVKKWIRNGLLWYAVLSLAILTAGVAVNSGNSILYAKSYLLLLPFGLCMSAADLLFKDTKISRWLCAFLHFAITLVAFLLFIFLPNATNKQPVKILGAVLIAAIVYWLLFLFVHIFKRSTKKLFED